MLGGVFEGRTFMANYHLQWANVQLFQRVAASLSLEALPKHLTAMDVEKKTGHIWTLPLCQDNTLPAKAIWS